MQCLEAKDGSKNYIWDIGPGQKIEARYVVRDKGEVICYLSSQTACMRACRMCHLTRTGQVEPEDVEPGEFLNQAIQVLNARDVCGKGFDKVSYNFMARGEPLDNNYVNSTLLKRLGKLAIGYGLFPRFKISTIMPQGADLNLIGRFWETQPDIYYSLYSVNPRFRKRWFPKAVIPAVGLDILKRWQDHTHKIPKIHLALIKGENDDEPSLYNLIEMIQDFSLRVDFNIVRYNPFDGLSKEGNWELAEYIFKEEMPESDVQVIQRVGYEAKASCGMFVS